MASAALLLAACLALAAAHPTWNEWKKLYNKSYETQVEEDLREHIYNSNVEFIDYENGLGHTYTLGVNAFSDLTHSEFKKFYLGPKIDFSYRINASALGPDDELFSHEDGDDGGGSINWANKGAVTPVKDQGQCGSCWSFSTTGSIEGQHFLSTGNLVSLSEQNLVDCSTQNDGCNGGLVDQAFQYVIQNNGIDTEASYPYQAVQGTCQFNPSNVGATISSFQDVTSGSISALQNALFNVGPISVAMDAEPASFQHYQSGIWNPPSCSSTQLDHAVLAVGYGTDSGTQYWLIKNSWGTSWGMQGYFEIATANNECGIATTPSYPTGVNLKN